MAFLGEKAMKHPIRCGHCGRQFSPNPRVKNQRYCSDRACQNARKRLWQREKLATDPDYKENRRDSQKAWCSRNPHYWKDYRRSHPVYTRRNRELQNLRDRGRASHSVDLAKMDALEPLPIVKPGTYYLVPDLANLAKMDESAQKVCLIPIT
jgi:hypothetical protein